MSFSMLTFQKSMEVMKLKVLVDLASMNFKEILNYPLVLKKRMENNFGSSKTIQM